MAGRYSNVTGGVSTKVIDPRLGMLSWDEVIEQGALLMEQIGGSAVYVPEAGQKKKVKQGLWFADPQPELPNMIRPELPEWAKDHTVCPAVVEETVLRSVSNAGKPYTGTTVAPVKKEAPKKDVPQFRDKKKVDK